MMNKPREDELTAWLTDMSALTGKETIIVDRGSQLPKVNLVENLLVLLVIMALTFAASATYYLSNPAMDAPEVKPSKVVGAAIASEPTGLGKELGKEIVNAIPTSSTTSSTTTTSTSSSTTTTTTSTTTSSTTTSTTLQCGGDLEPACVYEDGSRKCAPGLIEGSKGLCHVKTCVPNVASGNDGSACGFYALQYCSGGTD